ncbi:hypothetical protein JDV02_009834 [Purpureocillium takamizusanense]|uniref:Molybdate-anion transporter n=1 Tax=Purpureocillium takamizusanense TaxID=2060973 RepID=A0A9Q8QQK9_9HYPO|nr:uncharacterized protein JDV02_009834 [Purpureocillium takamizusanense]UNI24055.1 hypothetical protein JDV02_009834 [Purpureocillium takamizusanense]
MDFYLANLVVLCAINTSLLYCQRRCRVQAALPSINDTARGSETLQLHRAGSLQARFLVVYAFAVAADWLQGPHIYAIYKYEKHLPEESVALLYAAGFVSGAASAPMVGQLADRFGRRLACQIYCFAACTSCSLILRDSLSLLLLGRVFGGISTTLLFSVFEAWMIAEFHRQGLDRSGTSLDQIFGRMTLVSSTVAIVAGVVGNILVEATGTRLWPFAVSSLSAVVAFCTMSVLWQENYGIVPVGKGLIICLLHGARQALSNRRIAALGLASCCLEGAMYLFVFFWSAALKSARVRIRPDEDVPYGLIFSCFMCSMALGSLISQTVNGVSSAKTAATNLVIAMLAASASLSGAAVLDNEPLLFWSFCLLEFCFGIYFPAMAALKSQFIEDDFRGAVYSSLRLPLNLFVVIAHSLDCEAIETSSFWYLRPF